ncbi:bifunctional UDP-2,4-diacetamido-2,4,6-trideoxy-beta-L-altropyranose hydrolase/GNAT family N-acetyltransferase [Reinekea sp. G2M2-21]|uniref:bifunctional UDP-2,4-diacetamido-2,4,6-trideoxy-beta-L-altropyranose hydrolase/GNAT family N-acetyltransferase n=1 Tax=Reinekea sp. G2M2-21 TaxID=2788942 RepID=UPI0018A88F44|nr:bifunctional UDP-2,4-diacetamido-2,4,6-trideoxy-beta-L-altropyranose hydrolase/GNAT family N-acetyltransferase [Reinekea sp. G2M2-21]
MTTPVLLARLSFSASSGAGHVYRSLSIIECALRDGWQVVVVTDDPLPHLPIEHSALTWRHLIALSETEQDDANQSLEMCTATHKPTVVWLDHYELAQQWERELLNQCPVAVIDDICRTHDPAVWLIDYFPGRRSLDYALNEERCLLGLRYLLLRSEFRQQRIASRQPGLKKILIQFGGADRNSYDVPVLQALHADANLTGTIVWLQGERDLLDFWQRQDLTVDVLEHCADVALLYLSVDCAIGAAGVSVWERQAVGLPSIVFQAADNQADNFRYASKFPGIWAQPGLPETTTTQWMQALHSLRKGSQISSEHLDVYGANRVWQAIIPKRFCVHQNLQFIPFSQEHIHSLYSLQSVPGVRRFSRNPQIPTFAEHESWCASFLSNNAESGWLVHFQERPVAWLRLSAPGAADFREISLLVHPEFHAMGIGNALLRFAQEQSPLLAGYVMPENTASRRLFERVGFKEKNNWFYWPELPAKEDHL